MKLATLLASLACFIPPAMGVLKVEKKMIEEYAPPVMAGGSKESSTSSTLLRRHLANEEETTNKSQGPWPECMNMQAEDCVEYIESVAPDVFCVIVYPSTYDFHRIWIHVDKNNIVHKTPGRG